VDTDTDPAHCGGCDASNACAAGQACLAGKCVAGGAGACQDPTPDACLANNRVACVNEDSDPQHCGNCFTACATNEVCIAGNCRRYVPATGCNACPCATECVAGPGLGGQVACCSNPSASTQPICVAGTTACP
jgi:hypothetical protein